ncbi:unnamed protein product [Psylliodes chrysocephalus]|uniref:Transmembrane protein n=1 Tax=Psylliodes chrysocephalus TaxID=3402493 RepID=A0A9P0G833_9CUCU|nr:unnamed protein product [Psylliodes chrysocephala]
MFINKLKTPSIESNAYSKMSYVTLFFKTELTCIPSILSKWLGDYYNNALCNGATWVFLLWWILHTGFNKFLNALLKKLKFKEYERDRLTDILWYLGFYGTGVVYCGAALSQNEVELFNFKKMQVPSISNLPTQVVLGYTLILMFYLHSAFWEGITKMRIINMLSYLFLFFFMLSSYILRVVEISFTLSALISIAQVVLHITKGLFVVLDQRYFYTKILIAALFIVTLAVHVAIHLIVIPLTFIVPLGLKIISDYPNILLLFLLFNLMGWLGAEIYQGVLFKFLNHWLYHGQDIKRKDSISSSDGYEQLDKHQGCLRSLTECALFLPRDDLAYEIQKIRKEIEERRARQLALRKPKNMFVQTLKCMLTINKKLKQKRKRLEDESESSENTDENQQDDLLPDDEHGTHENYEEDVLHKNELGSGDNQNILLFSDDIGISDNSTDSDDVLEQDSNLERKREELMYE